MCGNDVNCVYFNRLFVDCETQKVLNHSTIDVTHNLAPFAYIIGTIKYSPDLRAETLKIYSLKVTLCMHNVSRYEETAFCVPPGLKAMILVSDGDEEFVAICWGTLALLMSQFRVEKRKYDHVFPFMLQRPSLDYL